MTSGKGKGHYTIGIPLPSFYPQVRLLPLRIFYVSVLIVFAVITLTICLNLREFSDEQATMTTLITLSGHQRMIAERIELKATLLVHEADSSKRAALRTDLAALMEELLDTHNDLVIGHLPDGRSYEVSPTAKSLYWDGEFGLNQLTHDYVTAATDLSLVPDSQLGEENDKFVTLLRLAPTLFAEQDQMAEQYISENQTRITQFEERGVLFLSLSFLGLGAAGLLFAYPVTQRMGDDQQKLITEIDSRREAEHVLLKSESLYRILMSNLPGTAVLLFDRDMRYLLAEGSILAEAGYNRCTMIGKTPYDVLPPQTLETLLPLYRNALQGIEAEFEHVSAAGKSYQVRSVSIKNAQGQIMGGLLIICDVHQRRLIEKELVEKRDFIERVLTSMPDLIFIYDVDQRKTLFESRNLAEILGYAPDHPDLIDGTCIPNLVHPDDLALVSVQYKDLFQTSKAGDVFEIEIRLRAANGQWHWYSARTTVFSRYPDGQVRQLVGLMQDIDQRKQTETALREHEHFIRQITAAIPDIIYIYDLHARSNIYANRPFGEAMGYTPQQIQAMGDAFMEQTMHPDDWAAFPRHFANLNQMPENTVLEFEYRMKTPQGGWVWLNSRDIVFARDGEGSVTHILGVARDITERKNGEHALLDSEKRFRQIAETVRNAFWIVAPDHRTTFYVSPAYETIWGRPCSDMYDDSRAFTHAIYPEDQERVTRAMSEAAYNIEYRIVRPDGTVRWVNSRSYPIINSDGEIERIISVSDDVTERKEYETQAFAIAVEREHIRLLAEFVRDTSHDLRTPLTIITTGLYLLRRITDADKRLERIDQLEKQVQHLDKIIADLHAMSNLDITRRLDIQKVDLNQILRDLYIPYEKASRVKDQTLQLHLEPELKIIEGDPERIKHALMNLIDNALLYTGEGGRISIDSSSTDEYAIISVADTGIGIPAEHQGRIFDRFYKVDFARTSGHGGPGLGLSIVKKIAEMHKGRIEVESMPGEGSIFRLYLPKKIEMD